MSRPRYKAEGLGQSRPPEKKAKQMNAILLKTSEQRIRENAAKQLEKQGKLEWKQDNHRAAICRHVASLFQCEMADDRIKALYADLGQHGFGGNASQFRQWLESEDVALLPAATAAKQLADGLLIE